ncbi:MAG TPA: cell surface protein SprA, partial [Flavobacteriales bacterium]|nr:cell surface protein SprA [Flavobacteriales bacterium]
CRDDDVVLFVRLGTDFEENYYEYELPLKMTAWGASSAEEVWPTSNEVDIEFDKLIDLKLERNDNISSGLAVMNQPYSNSTAFPGRIVRVKGNPNLQGIKTVMVGVRNPRKSGPSPYKPDDGKSKCLEVWINELRLTDFDQHGGWAATGRVNTNLADFGNLALSGSYSTPYWGSIEKRVSERQRETIMAFDAISSFELGKFFPEKWGIRLPMYLSYGENRSNPQFDPLQPDVLYPLSTEGMSADEKLKHKQKSQNYTRRRSINFANVKKERTGDAKPHFWDVSNWSFTYAYNEIFHRDINVEYNMNKTYRAGANYAFNKNSKPWEPFAKNKFLSKSKWFGLIKDFNLFLAPKVVAFRNEVSRSYIENIIRANYGALAFPNYTKNFFWTRGYDVKYDITKNLKFDYTATNNGVIGEPTGRVNKLYRDEYQVFKDSVQSSIMQGGTTTHYNHTVNLTYQLPLSKIPLTDWISVNAKYSAGYDWQRAPFGQDTLGHIVQNSRNVSLNGQLNFVTLYNHWGWLKKINQKAGGSPAKKPGVGKIPGKTNDGKSDTTNTKKKEKDTEKFTLVENIARFMMGIKTASVTFSTTDGILLPGYGNKTQFVGMSPNWTAPSYGFVIGKQNRDIFGNPNNWGEFDEYAFYAADRGWLIKNENLNRQYTTNHAKNFQGKMTIEPLTGLKIDLNADKNFSENTSSFFRYIDTLPDGTPVNAYQLQNPMVTGVMSVSINAWKTSFVRDDKSTYANKTFSTFRDLRTAASALLAAENPNSTGSDATDPNYRDGYGGTQQDVIITSFIAAYTGQNIDKKMTNPFKQMPFPNWRVTFDPMAKARWKFFKRYFRSLTLSHGYRSTLNIANYSTNLQAQVDNDGFLVGRDIAGNFINSRQINAITIAEQFSPLFSMDIKWKMNEKDQRGLITKLEIKRDRNIALSLTNNQITEIRSKEYVFGTGYTFPKLKLPFKIAGKKPESDLEARADVSVRDNVTVTRKIVENYNQPTSGQMLISIKTSVNYTVAQNITIRLFFDKTVTDPKVSNSFRTSNASSGIAIRLSLQ